MKPLFAVLALLTFASHAFADLNKGEIRQYEIEKFKFNASHARNPQNGTVTVNEAAQTVTMEVQPEMPVCPPGKYCIQVMPVPVVVELPIVSIEKNSCGILKIVASEDMRPADGLLREIQIEDASELTCATLVAVPSTAKYKTSFYDRMNGKPVTKNSKMELKRLQDVTVAAEIFNFQEGKLVDGFPQLEVPETGILQISQDTVSLEIYIGLNCGNGPCPMYMPHPIQVNLPIVKRTPGTCGAKIFAQQEVRTHFGISMTTVEITDYRAALCEIYTKYPLHVKFTTKDVFAGGSMTKTGIFYFQK